MAELLTVARKEFRSFFTSPAALLFLGAFLAATLFIVFWGESFFARNIADVRPLFQWMPVLLIFLVAALTMRAWSEERRAGTLEILLTSPISPIKLLLGKFLAVWALVGLALALTLPLPITVTLLGPLDWGPVVGGYVATMLLAAAYVAIGLYMSGRTDNPIVALILTAVVGGLLYLIGSPMLTSLFGHRIGGVLELIGTGSRFESITRGVLDLRDLYYYLSIVGIFLALNLLGLERLRSAGNPASINLRRWRAVTALVVVNFLAVHFWLTPVGWARSDITDGKVYSLSPVTEHYLEQLQEPLFIRGYFSSKTHPLLAPLVPRIEDLLEEYAVVAGGRARVEFIDPHRDQEAAEEAARYGVQPVPFQMASRYQAEVVNSYFDIVVAYGDEYETLGYADLIDIKVSGGDNIEVGLKNPEYAITRAIRKVVQGYQAGGSPFDLIKDPIEFSGYISEPSRLPEELQSLRAELETLLAEVEQQAGSLFTATLAAPEAGDGALAREIEERYGFAPQIASLFDPQPFWFYMLLQSGGETVQVPLPETLDKEALERSLNAAVRRLAPGFLKTVAVVRPPQHAFGSHGYQRLSAMLGENVRIRETDLGEGRVPAEADLLMVLAPSDLSEKQLFAIDQFLMRGGSVILATAPFDVSVGRSLNASMHRSGLEDWLRHHGIELQETMVLDPRNAALPVPVQRSVGGLSLREIHMLPYPHFPDLRADGLNAESAITAGLGQLTLNWASPIEIDADRNGNRQVVELLRSSAQSWTSDSLNVVPDYQAYPTSGFHVDGERGERTLAVALEGRFESYYKDKDSPLANADGEEADATSSVVGVIDRSPDTARLIVIASNAFASDAAIALTSEGMGTIYTKPLEFMQNAVDWSLEDRGLLALRGRSQFARMLEPLGEADRMFWEYLNYGLALGGLLLVWGWRAYARRLDQARYQRILAEV